MFISATPPTGNVIYLVMTCGILCSTSDNVGNAGANHYIFYLKLHDYYVSIEMKINHQKE